MYSCQGKNTWSKKLKNYPGEDPGFFFLGGGGTGYGPPGPHMHIFMKVLLIIRFMYQYKEIYSFIYSHPDYMMLLSTSRLSYDIHSYTMLSKLVTFIRHWAATKYPKYPMDNWIHPNNNMEYAVRPFWGLPRKFSVSVFIIISLANLLPKIRLSGILYRYCYITQKQEVPFPSIDA